MEIFILIENNKYIFLAVISIILATLEYFKSIKTNRTFSFRYFQDLFFWFLIIDNIILPSSEDKIEPILTTFFEQANISYLRELFNIRDFNLYLQFFIVFITFELINYLFHRFIKHNRFTWQLHKVHHSSKHLNQFSDARNHPLFIFIEGLLINLPIMSILSPTWEPLVIYGVIRTFWGPLIHMNCDIK
ncbi:sterol desaturase family protein [Halobacteriovorax sp. HLS]|uniref:sterol desaturase family protein n=1 Tax=Halobacteriovorax sp. HLS TaxID=2234000 RepID=UPI000FD9549E|nr:sterol desaturase family protein [Halobacteriovorax sp. HLS]